jgi:hypothetical protein
VNGLSEKNDNASLSLKAEIGLEKKKKITQNFILDL